MAEAPNFNVSGLQFRLSMDPESFDSDEWRGFQELSREAYQAAFSSDSLGDAKWSAEEVDAFVKWDEPEYFRASRLDPRVAQDRGDLFPNQIWRDPIIVAAYDGDTPVAFTTSWNNTSDPLKHIKMLIPPILPLPIVGHRKHVWVREMVTHPDLWAPKHYQVRPHGGLAHILGYLELEPRHRKQPVATYTLTHARRMMGIQRNLGFEPQPATAQKVEIAGRCSRKVNRYRMVAPHVGTLLNRLNSPELAEAVRLAKLTMQVA